MPCLPPAVHVRSWRRSACSAARRARCRAWRDTHLDPRRPASPRPALALLAALLLAASWAGRSAATPGAVPCSIDGDRVTVTLHAETFRVIDTPAGQRLRMERFGELGIPGAPRLPIKRFLIALPPGARAESVEIAGTESTELPDTYRIAPAPPIALLPDMPRWEEASRRLRAEWTAEHDAVYGAGQGAAAAFPPRIAWLAGRGTLRKYAYASIAFCPFTYHPRSGRLEHHRSVELVIECAPAPSSGPEARHLDAVMHDRAARDGEAAALFANFDAIADLYAGGEAPAAPPQTLPLQVPQAQQPKHQPPQPAAPLTEDTYDYVIITTSALQPAIDSSNFIAWKSAQGHAVRTVLTTGPEIASQPGIDLAERIRNFLRSSYAPWGIEYVLMVGDYATVPMRICYPDPTFHVYNPGNPGLIAPGTPTDYYYADLSYPDAISWDADGDGYPGEYGEDAPDFLAEVAVGRIPVNELGRITYSLDKLVAFEQDTGAWKRNVLHAGSILFFANQDHGDYPFIDGATCLDSIETGLMPGYTITHMSERAGLVTSPFNWPPISETAFTGNWRNGEHAVVNWSGHGWSDGAYRTVWTWDDGDGVPESTNGELQSYRFIGSTSPNLDDDHPSIVFAVSCNVGYPDPNPYGNLGIDLLTRPGWGASAGIVSSARPSAISRDWKNDPGGTEQICFDFNHYLLVEGERVGDALYDGKFHATSTYGWERVYEYMNLYNFNLFGDPALALGGATTAVAGTARTPAGAVIRLLPGTPNPFASVTDLRIALSQPGPLRAAIYDAGGRHVATLAGGRHAAGELALRWNGTADDGERLGSGLYFLVVEAGGQRAARKLVVVR